MQCFGAGAFGLKASGFKVFMLLSSRVYSPGLVVDSSVCGTNSAVYIPERT